MEDPQTTVRVRLGKVLKFMGTNSISRFCHSQYLEYVPGHLKALAPSQYCIILMIISLHLLATKAPTPTCTRNLTLP